MRTLGDFLVRDRTSHRRNKEAEVFFVVVACYLFCAQFISKYIASTHYKHKYERGIMKSTQNNKRYYTD